MPDADVLAALCHTLPADLDDYLHDAERMAWVLATIESARLINQEMHAARLFSGPSRARHDPEGRNQLLTFALETAFSPERHTQWGSDALICEFGVHKGETISHLASSLDHLRKATPVPLPNALHGFDSFVGLPDDWFLGRKAGRFSLDGSLPSVPDSVTLHKGWFSDTLPAFLQHHTGPAALLHLDADLYSSTKTVLDAFTHAGRIKPGTVLVFDEFFNYPGWQQHEYKAFVEWSSRCNVQSTYLGIAPRHYSVAVQVVRIGA